MGARRLRVLASSSFGVLPSAEAAAFADVAIRPLPEWDRIELESADVIAIPASEVLRSAVLDRAINCRLVAVFGTGTDGVDVERATELGIPVANTPGIATVSVADLAMALLLAVSRQLPSGRELAEAGRVVAPDEELGFNLEDRMLGLVGFGQIGRLVAKRASGFGMDVIYCRSRSSRDGDPRRRSLEEVLEGSDAISLHAPLTPETRNLLDKHAIGRMKSRAVLVNTARAGLVDEDALIAALDAGHLYGAGLDVYAGEPLRPGRLLRHPRVVVTAHIGGATRETRARMGTSLLDVLRQAALQRLPGTLVNPAVRNTPSLRKVEAVR